MKTILAFAVIYVVWGSTFLAIRVGVREVPPFLLAGLRFSVAGALVYAWAVARGENQPDRAQWRATLPLALNLIVVCYGLLFWAEQRVTSGMAAVLAATIPMFMTLSEVIVLRTVRLTVPLVIALVVGLFGVVVLTSETLIPHGVPVDRAGAAALVFGSLAWAVGSVLQRVLPLPAGGTMRAGSQMLAGGIMLVVLAFPLGEWGRFHPTAVSAVTWVALGWLIVAGSIVAYTAYVWLLQHVAPTKVGSYAYVNPVVAVLLGYWLLGEPLDRRTVTGSLLVLVSVVGMLTLRAPSRTGRGPLADGGRRS